MALFNNKVSALNAAKARANEKAGVSNTIAGRLTGIAGIAFAQGIRRMIHRHDPKWLAEHPLTPPGLANRPITPPGLENRPVDPTMDRPGLYNERRDDV